MQQRSAGVWAARTQALFEHPKAERFKQKIQR
jgi:hypothetical protein